MLEYLFIAFVVICAIQAFFHLAFSVFFPKRNLSINSSEPTLPVSVIICSKNEADNLKNFLPLFEKQNYASFELVLINDNSSDATLEVMKSFKSNTLLPVKIVNVLPTERFWGNKKYALTLGIKAARFEQLLFTDADCKPLSNDWISEMVSQINATKHIVLGYGAYKKIKKSFLNKIIRYETLLTALQYFSYAKMGMPYMGVGRNLSYNKNTFFKARGFMNHMHIKSGDDDLFINQVATNTNTVCQIAPNSFTESLPKLSWKSWILQKRRHISTASAYKTKHKLSLGLFVLTQLLFFILAPILLSSGYKIEIALSFILLRYLLFYGSILNSGNRLNEKDLVLFAPFFEIFLLLSQIYIFIQNLISKPEHW